MQRPDFIQILTGVAAAWPLAAYTQQSKKIWRIGMLETVAAPLKTADYGGFLAGMKALGYVEARDFKIDTVRSMATPDRFRSLRRSLLVKTST
jgi:hypothetical protein